MPGSRFGDAPVAITSPSKREPLPAAEQHGPLGQVEPGGRLAEPPVEVEVVGRAADDRQRGRLRRLRAGQHLLRQRRAVVGTVRLVADDA